MEQRWETFESDVKSRTGGQGRRCHIARLADTLEPSAVAALDRALANKDLSASAIEKVLVRNVGRELAPSQWSIGNHRRGACRCNR